ncbi:energy-coupling factor transporter transmembrane component T family protein [Brachybacterium kimchii]|uniref:Energy-coupling factor transporter transmembrane protein EcfT n=1 Tax=Brachybacterium kimchii TaxID=2942909 RepID=A0ABY4N743_9MICO|nr:energy-coupling factor transporter transmembrane component T [Brachybacterium kimchii]UQN29602.1 energy-coupling factor transporter transmembrane protein EcfT [Brachybacterium kimchii]
MTAPLLEYVERPGLLHTLTGTAKLVLTIAMVLAAMISFDVRFLAALGVLSLIGWALSRVRLRDLATVLWIILTFMALNNLLIFVFAPGYGSELLGARHVVVQGPGRWDLTQEQLFYQLAVTLKYFAMLPAVLLFVATTRPPEFASSLHRIGVPYKVAFAVSLALRFIPDIQREMRTISQAQQARGLDISRKVGLVTRVRNVVSTLMPLLLGSLDRIETVSSAMELRGFGRGRHRTWYDVKPMRLRDWSTILGALAVVAASIVMVVVDGGRYWNPFEA